MKRDLVFIVVFGCLIFLFIFLFQPNIVKKEPKFSATDNNTNVQVITEYIKYVNPKIFNLLAFYIAENIERYSKKYKINENIVIGLIECESHFNVFSKSKSNAVGLMQINYKIWKKELKQQKILNNKYQLYDPKVNINAGLYILTKYLKQCKSLKCGLYKYYGKNSKTYYNKFLKAVGNYTIFKMKRR